ncbi:MAG: CDF family Co(II)/Ni(II) efflux transporter DmeF [Magnetococcales bacterium]|nr:CDF family Co(II)/Ni(II) efflux transporter DmeF [Magnetococcales bacterium]MBF0631425.1 CDF family Co(II)/Ni(II) efflux transporter DmeF [Magnetococcales bacterium]
MSFIPDLEKNGHSHTFDEGNPLAERNTRWATLLTATMMVIEIIGGWVTNSMALLADGWHMSSHALALGLSVLAYQAARTYARDPRFSFGTWKIEILGGYTSAVILAGIAILMLVQSLERLIAPTAIQYDQAMVLAISGLLVNLVCAWLLRDDHHDHHDHHGHQHHDHPDHHHDMNLRSAYVHVLSDAATSVLAIMALLGGKLWGADWLDPAMGIVGAALIAVWVVQLLRNTGRVLLDAEMDAPLVTELRATLAASPIEHTLTDLHVWRVGKETYACILALTTADHVEPDVFKEMLRNHQQLAHITVEINHEQPIGPRHPLGSQ